MVGWDHGRFRFPSRRCPRPLVGVLRVEDTDAALVKIVDLGGSVLMAVEDTTYWRLAAAADRPVPSSNSSLRTKPCRV